jgi:phage-related protein
MAWGLWNKIKQGFKKAGAVIKKAADVITNKVIKPFKPIIGGAISAINPAAGAIAGKVMDSVERFSDEGFTPFRRLKRG